MTVPQAVPALRRDYLGGQRDDPAGQRAPQDDDFADGDGQGEPARAGATRVEVEDAVARLRTLLLSMEWSDAEVRPLLEMEGLRRWCDGRTTGFGQLGRAIDTLPFQGAETVRAFVGRT